jgi:G3E family GTPase
MKQVRFIMLGGFLGAGKTTALGQVARHYQGQGLKVGIITNDQANNLVDTATFRVQGLSAEEIPGGCFCCRFDALTEAAGKLSAAERPDVLLAEPVGSCTDLVATVVQPLKRLYGQKYTVAPYIVLVDPVRARKILTGDKLGGFSPKVAYIFHKQLEEADAIAVNKSDTLSAAERAELASLIKKNFPQTETLLLSARTGEGLNQLLAFMERTGSYGRNIPEVDYDTYADGEAELGWLNSTCTLAAAAPFDADELLLELARTMQQALRQGGAEVAHLKMLLHACGKTGIVNLVRGDAAPELSQRAGATARTAELIVNARVHTEPEALWTTVERCLIEITRQKGIQLTLGMNQHFKPGRPVPTHRYAEAV